MENNILKPPQYEKLFLEIPQYEASSKNLILLKTSSQEYAYFKDGYQLHPNTVLKQVMQYKVSTPLQHQFDGLKKYPFFIYIFNIQKTYIPYKTFLPNKLYKKPVNSFTLHQWTNNQTQT